MTNITIHKTGDKIVGFIIDGHTGFANFGEDIVCASISILSTTTVNSLNLVAGIDEKDINYEINDELGYLKVRTNKINNKSDVIYNTFLVGIQLLIENYSDYITLITEEV